MKTKGWITVAALFAVALLIRSGRLLATDLAPDAAVSGVMSYAVLGGEFPLFFYGQKFMGSLDAFLSAPLYLLLGPSTLTVNLLPWMLSLGTLWLVFLILGRLLHPPGTWMGLLFLAVPTAFSLFCLTDGKSFYHLALFFSALLMWVTLELDRCKTSESFFFHLTWGVLAGLAFWTNFLSVTLIGACGVYLLFRIKLRRLLPSWFWLATGGILGALPLVVFALFREAPGVGWVQPGSAYNLTDRLSAVFFNALPVVLGINPRDPAAGLFPLSFGFVVYLLLLVLLLGASAGLFFQGLRTPRHEALLPVFVLIFSLGAVLAGGRPEEYRTLDQRYFLPLYLGLPFCWGFWADRLRQRKTVLVLLGALLRIKSGHYFSLDSRIKESNAQFISEGFHHIFNTNVRYSNYQEVPAGLKIEAAGSNAPFRLLREVRGYVGPFYLSGPNPFFMYRYPRIECYFEPQAIRYLRLTQLGKIRKDWPVRELLLFGSNPAAQEIPWSEAREQLLKVVGAHPLKNLYADAWPSSVIAAASLERKPGVLLPTIEVDIYGSRGPSLKDPLWINPAAGNGLLVSIREAGQAAARLAASEIFFNRVPAGRHTLFILRGRAVGPAIPIVRVSSETNPREASDLAQGLSPGKRWSSQGPQRPGMGLTLDLGVPKNVGWVSLHCPRHPRDYPRGIKADFSLDGKRWNPLATELVEPLAFTGQVLLLARGPVQRYRIHPAVTTRYVRLTLTESDPVNWWSVEAVQVNQQKDP